MLLRYDGICYEGTRVDRNGVGIGMHPEPQPDSSPVTTTNASSGGGVSWVATLLAVQLR